MVDFDNISKEKMKHARDHHAIISHVEELSRVAAGNMRIGKFDIFGCNRIF